VAQAVGQRQQRAGGQHVGLEVVDDGLLDVYFGVKKLGDCTSGTCG